MSRIHFVLLKDIAPEMSMLTTECNVHSIEEFVALMRFAQKDKDMCDALATMTKVEWTKLEEMAKGYSERWPNLPVLTVKMKVIGVVKTPEGERTDVDFEFVSE